jgi:hypothetical protein
MMMYPHIEFFLSFIFHLTRLSEKWGWLLDAHFRESLHASEPGDRRWLTLHEGHFFLSLSE